MRARFAISSALLLFVIGSVKGQGWQGIVPLHSTCEDAKRILKLATCEPGLVQLEEFTVFVNFSSGVCQPEWNVAVGTVLTLDVRPKRSLRLSDLRIDETKYSRRQSSNTENTVYLENPAEGLNIAVFDDGRIRSLFYGPSSKDEHLRCTPRITYTSNTQESGSMKLDQYGFITFKEEVSRLDQFATTLLGWVGAHGYIVVYPGRKATLKQAEARAARAKTYLVNKRGLKDRVLTMIGGRREDFGIELYITVKNGSPPLPSPTREPTQPLKRD